MTRAACPRQFEAEAMRDGRLAGSELASFERHMRVCRACSREVQALEELADSARVVGRDEADELHVRRERTRLLAAFERTLVAPAPRSPVRGPVIWASVGASLFAAVLWALRAAPATQPVRAPVAVIGAAAGTVWSRRIEGAREEIRLAQGTLSIHVDHASQAPAAERVRLWVLLPDGRLEDVGTTFRVSVEQGRTTAVEVEEGRVVLRIQDRPAIALSAGGRWARVPDATPPPPKSAAVARDVAASPSRARGPARSVSRAPPAALVPQAPRVSDAADDFRIATATLDAGDARRAAAAFENFLVKHPDDARAQDAAYMRVIALQRTGDAAAMLDAARAYLSRFPSGFRRAEVRLLLRGKDERYPRRN